MNSDNLVKMEMDEEIPLKDEISLAHLLANITETDPAEQLK